MLRYRLLGLALICVALIFTASSPSESVPDKSILDKAIAEKTAGMHHVDGYFPLDYDAKTGKLYLTVDKLNTDFLYLDQLPRGLGQNDIGLDRGQLGEGRVVRFERFGPKVMLVQPNLQHRSSATDAAERTAVTESFGESVLWGFKVEAEDGAKVAAGDGAKVLVDATDFFLRDAHGVAETLQTSKQGQYKLDASRSALAEDNTKNFPLNTEVEALLTFTIDAPVRHGLVAEVTPDAHSITVREHHSLIALPDAGYQPRTFDPGAGYFPITYRDYSAPLGSSIDVNLISRHRLQKKNPHAVVSEAVKPLTYYVDRGAPEPIRTALVEGARWWNQAFEAAGFRNAFRVEVLPEGADPMDIRYNMIQWVHRSTRGWSYGASVVDPRTGEIIKGQVTLGSLRGRQDYLIAESLLSPYVEGKPIPPAMQRMVLARIRQLAAHEVGHTLGLAHNFAASSFSQGASVMDYPHPYITLDANGNVDLSHAYATGIGEWDKVAIRYGYSQFPASSEAHELDTILADAQTKGLYFITDEDARPLGSAHPHAHLWDNGPEPADELDRILKIRSVALAHFSANAIRPGAPMATLEDTLVPLYLLHRYQTEAAAKEIGGLDYRYALRGDHQVTTAVVSPEQQRHALQSVLKTLDPAMLTLPESLLKNLPPRPPAYPRTRESFPSNTGLAFDPVAAAQSAADLTLTLLFEPARAARLNEYHAREASEPSLDDVIDDVLAATWNAPHQSGLVLEVQQSVQTATLEHLLALGTDSTTSSEVRAIVRARAVKLKDELGSSPEPNRSAAVARIDEFLKKPAEFKAAPPVEAPPGMPIGDDSIE